MMRSCANARPGRFSLMPVIFIIRFPARRPSGVWGPKDRLYHFANFRNPPEDVWACVRIRSRSGGGSSSGRHGQAEFLVPVDESGQAFGDRRARFEAEVATARLDGGRGRRHVAGLHRLVPPDRPSAQRLLENLDEANELLGPAVDRKSTRLNSSH